MAFFQLKNPDCEFWNESEFWCIWEGKMLSGKTVTCILNNRFLQSWIVPSSTVVEGLFSAFFWEQKARHAWTGPSSLNFAISVGAVETQSVGTEKHGVLGSSRPGYRPKWENCAGGRRSARTPSKHCWGTLEQFTKRSGSLSGAAYSPPPQYMRMC